MGFMFINEEQKVRITLSNRARLTMAEDMDIFGVTKAASFINTVFTNFRSEATSSISLYLQQRKLELEQMFSDVSPGIDSKRFVIELLLLNEKKEIQNTLSNYTHLKGNSKLYHINNDNVKYLLEDCEEDVYYDRPGQYLRSIIEEYCALPFIKRERIFKKDTYDTIERACREQKILKVKADYYGKNQLFYVYPYKIVPDQLHTQSYLVCYSRKAEDEERDKIVASFSMARINVPTMLSKTFHLNKQEVSQIESQISKYSPAYLIGKPELVKVRLTEKGKRSYQSRLYSRPEKIEDLSSNEIYVFDCTHQQIFNYFFPFGADAEIISPEYLRNRFISAHQKALERYNASS